jgi:hypothetical protein
LEFSRTLQPDANHRSQPRSNVFLSAALIVGTAAVPVRLRNLSTRGALLDGPSLPPAGSRVRVLRGELSADGEIAWQDQSQAGLRFSGEIEVEKWVQRIGHRGQQRVDETVAALRAHERAPLTERSGDPSLAELSEELDRICQRLADSPAMTVELAEELLRLNGLAGSLQRLAGREQS